MVLIVAIILFVVVLTYVENRAIHFGSDFPISNTILMFTLININLLLLLLLIFLVFRNLVKLFYDRKRRITGAKLRTKLVCSFIGITLLPTAVLFLFSINFIASSIEFWFKVPVEQALENSLSVGRRLYSFIEEQNTFLIKRISYQIRTKKMLNPKKRKTLSKYIYVVQREFNIQAVEVYIIEGIEPDIKAIRVAAALSSDLKKKSFPALTADRLHIDSSKNVQSVFDHMAEGELVRTIGVTPFSSKKGSIKAFVVLSVLLPVDLSRNMSSISKGFEEYQQIKLLKEPIRITYYITISIVALLVLFCAIWFGLILAKSISVPIMELAEATRRVAEGDLGFSIGRVADDEIGSLVDSFNKMTRDLRTGREQLEYSAQMLRQRNVEIEERRRYMEIVLKNVSTGVITLDSRGYVSTSNTSAEKMLNIRSEDILNKSYKTLLKGQHLNLAREIMEQLTDSPDDAVEFPLRIAIDGRPKSFIMHVNALKDDAGQYMGMVMVFDDLTELEKAQRMAAWREVARRIAHEVKNPLTPIKLSAQRLKRRYSSVINERVFDECNEMIIDHVDLIKNLVNEFASFARFPGANPKPCDLPPIIEETVALYREGHQNIEFKVLLPEEAVCLNLDRQQIKQALINLVNNAIGAIRETGQIAITLSRIKETRKVRIEVADNGKGISDENKARLFEPYFSTKKTGMGLGLAIVSSIIEDHHGKISVRDNTPEGAVFMIEFSG